VDHSLFFNHLSLPANDYVEAYSKLFDAFQGVLCLNQGNDRFLLYFDGENLDTCELANGFTYGDFKRRLNDNQEVDLLLFIYEIEDKTPSMVYLNDDNFEYLCNVTLYIKDKPYKNMDIFGHAFLQNGIMLSLGTHILWCNHLIEFCCLEKGSYIPLICNVDNISNKVNGIAIVNKWYYNIEEICCEALFTDQFLSWFNELNSEDKDKTKRILTHCYEYSFNLGRPLIDTLNGSRFPNMKEIRVGSSYGQSGKIRVLFAMDTNRMANVLIGFIKHSNDYSEQIALADSLFSALSES
jgi:hypothetical protein